MFFFFPRKPAPSGGIVVPGTAAWTLAAQALSATGAVIATPTTLAGLVAWYRADLGVTLVQGPVVATGTSPPAVTMTGTPATAANTIIITITLSGIVGVAQFSWSLNGVTQQTGQTVTSTFALGATGITAHFPAGTYNTVSTPDVYTSVVTVSSWADQSGNGHTASQATALQQFAYLPTGGPNSRAAVAGNSAQTTFMTAAIGALAKPCWVWMVYQATASNSQNYVLDGGGANTMAVLQTGFTVIKLYSGSFVTWSAATLSAFAAYGLTFGSSGSIYSNAALEASGTTGTTGSTSVTIGAAGSQGASADMQMCELVIANTPPAANALSAYSQSLYGFG